MLKKFLTHAKIAQFAERVSICDMAMHCVNIYHCQENTHKFMHPESTSVKMDGE